MTLETYSKEIGLTEPMTLDQLIESHRHLRGLNLEYNEQWRNGISEGREQGYIEGKAEAVERGWHPIERLRAMTLAEIAALIAANAGSALKCLGEAMTPDILAQLNEADRENAALRARVQEMEPLTICKCGDQFDADSPGICPACQSAETVALKAKLEEAKQNGGQLIPSDVFDWEEWPGGWTEIESAYQSARTRLEEAERERNGLIHREHEATEQVRFCHEHLDKLGAPRIQPSGLPYALSGRLSRLIGDAVDNHWRATLSKMSAERIQLKSQAAALAEALSELRAVVKGECPGLLDEDRGGCARLDIAIDTALTAHREVR